MKCYDTGFYTICIFASLNEYITLHAPHVTSGITHYPVIYGRTWSVLHLAPSKNHRCVIRMCSIPIILINLCQNTRIISSNALWRQPVHHHWPIHQQLPLYSNLTRILNFISWNYAHLRWASLIFVARPSFHTVRSTFFCSNSDIFCEVAEEESPSSITTLWQIVTR